MPNEAIKAEEVINGSWGEVWHNNDYLGEVKGIEIKLNIDYEDVNTVRNLSTGSKMLGYSGTGVLKLHKVTSRFNMSMLEALEQGKQLYSNITTKLADPNARGEERYTISNVVFEELTIANFEAKTALEEEIPFRFEKVKPIDQIA